MTRYASSFVLSTSLKYLCHKMCLSPKSPNQYLTMEVTKRMATTKEKMLMMITTESENGAKLRIVAIFILFAINQIKM